MSPAMFCAVKNNPRLLVIGTLVAASLLLPVLGAFKHFLP
jgi:hypothetical protein